MVPAALAGHGADSLNGRFGDHDKADALVDVG